MYDNKSPRRELEPRNARVLVVKVSSLHNYKIKDRIRWPAEKREKYRKRQRKREKESKRVESFERMRKRKRSKREDIEAYWVKRTKERQRERETDRER